MDNKQKKKLLLTTFKAVFFICLICFAWIGYFTVNNFLKMKSNILWLDITILAIASLMLIVSLIMIGKIKKTQNLYGLSSFIIILVFITVLLVAVGIFVMFYYKYNVSFVYKATILLLLFAEILVVVLMVCSHNLITALKNCSIYIEPEKNVPNFDDELYMKKKLDALNRKIEMQKIVKEIQEKENQLQNNK